MRLYTVQTVPAYKHLLRTGVLRGDWRRVWPEFRKAYRWMVTQMKLRGLDTKNKPPIWAWAKRPDMRSYLHREPVVRLTISVEPEDYLESDFTLWNAVLANDYLSLDEQDDLAHENCSQDTKTASWNRIFSYALRERVRNDWLGEYYAQFCLVELRANQVVKVEKFRAR